MNPIQSLKRSHIRGIKAIIEPHLWNSGYLDDDTKDGKRQWLKVFSFAPLYPNACRRRQTRSMGRVHNGDLTCIQGFYKDGTIDAIGGGCACTPFSAYCLEDVIAIYKWLVINFEKELTRANKYRKLRI